MPPAKPHLAKAEAAAVQYRTWDQFVEEATEGIEPFALILPGDDEPTIFPCPTGAQMEAFGVASKTMDDNAATVALLGEHAERIMDLTAGKPFTVRAKFLADLMTHYGLQSGGGQPNPE